MSIKQWVPKDRNKEHTVYDSHWHSSLWFCIQAFLITVYHYRAVHPWKGSGWGYGGPPDYSGSKLVCAYSLGRDCKIGFAPQGLQCQREFMNEPSSVSDTQNCCRPVCLCLAWRAPATVWMRECAQKKEEKKKKISFDVPFILHLFFSFTIFFFLNDPIDKVYSFVFHGCTIRCFFFLPPFKKKKLQFFSLPHSEIGRGLCSGSQ